MESPMTIRWHTNPKVRQGHNVRDPKYIKKQPHIQPDGEYEIWLHKDIDEAYHEIFDESVQEYNEKQTDSRRKIKDYRSLNVFLCMYSMYYYIRGDFGNDVFPGTKIRL